MTSRLPDGKVVKLEELIQAISNVGFPIVCCILMFYQNNQMQKTLVNLGNTLTSMNERLTSIEDNIERDM